MIKKLLLLFLLILIGCSEPEPINTNTLRYQDGIFYTKENNKEYSGPIFSTTKTPDRVYLEGKLKDGKRVGLFVFSTGEKWIKEGYFYDLDNIPKNYSGYVFSNIILLKNFPYLSFYTVKDGKLNGEFDKYSRDSLLRGSYKNGLKEGDYTEVIDMFWISRRVEESGKYVNDLRQGSYTQHITYSSYGKIYEGVKDFDNIHREVGTYLDGKKNGKYTMYGKKCNGGHENSYSRHSFCENHSYFIIEEGIYSNGQITSKQNFKP